MHKILYVEDNEDTAQAVKIILEKEGNEVHLAYSGKEGMKKGKERHYDLILLDYMLPDLTGWDLFESLRLKTKSKFAFLTIIPAENKRLSLMKELGLSDYMTKPFTKDELVLRVKKILKGGTNHDKNTLH